MVSSLKDLVNLQGRANRCIRIYKSRLLVSCNLSSFVKQKGTIIQDCNHWRWLLLRRCYLTCLLTVGQTYYSICRGRETTCSGNRMPSSSRLRGKIQFGGKTKWCKLISSRTPLKFASNFLFWSVFLLCSLNCCDSDLFIRLKKTAMHA